MAGMPWLPIPSVLPEKGGSEIYENGNINYSEKGKGHFLNAIIPLKGTQSKKYKNVFQKPNQRPSKNSED